MRKLSILLLAMFLLFAILACDDNTAKTPSAKVKNDEKIITISHGQKIRVEDHLSKNKYTLFEFYANWWSACKEIGPQVEAVVKKSDNLILRKIDVKTGDSPVVKQFDFYSIPHFILYEPGSTKGAVVDPRKILNWE